MAVLSTIGGTTHAASGSERLIQAVTDPVSGVSVKIARATSGDLIITVTDDVVSIRKQASRDRLLTTLQTKTERVSVTTDAQGLRWEDANGSMAVQWSAPDGLAAIQRTAASSPAIKAAIATLGHFRSKPESPVGHVLITMQSALRTMAGDVGGRVALADQVRQTQRGLRAVPVVFVPSANKCWDQYAIDAARIWDDFEDCVNTCAWYNFLGKDACMFLYEMRAMATFAGFEVCVATGSSS